VLQGRTPAADPYNAAVGVCFTMERHLVVKHNYFFPC